MTLTIQCLDIDAIDPDAVATFWAEALGWRRTYDSVEQVALEPPEHSIWDCVVPDLLFLRVSERKAAKNRLHLDLRSDNQAAEVTRLEALGATRVDIGQPSDVDWVVMADPEGNEFCVLSPLTAEQQAEVDLIVSSRTARSPQPS